MMLPLALAAFFTMPKSSNSRIPLTIVQDDLPELYQHCYEHVEPVSMGSAALKYDKTAEVAWASSQGFLLSPGTEEEIEACGRTSVVVRNPYIYIHAYARRRWLRRFNFQIAHLKEDTDGSIHATRLRAPIRRSQSVWP
jgi:hypothetical protein